MYGSEKTEIPEWGKEAWKWAISEGIVKNSKPTDPVDLLKVVQLMYNVFVALPKGKAEG